MATLSATLKMHFNATPVTVLQIGYDRSLFVRDEYVAEEERFGYQEEQLRLKAAAKAAQEAQQAEREQTRYQEASKPYQKRKWYKFTGRPKKARYYNPRAVKFPWSDFAIIALLLGLRVLVYMATGDDVDFF